MQRSEIAIFAAKALFVYIGWYLLYELWILPDGSLDEWLSLHIVQVSGWIVSSLGYDVVYGERIITIIGANGIEIVNGCNGLEAIGLFIGFVLAYPGNALRRAAFIPLGIFFIYLVNIFRIVVLTVTQYDYPTIFDFTHDYSTTTIFYVAIFLLWVVWVNYGGTTKVMNVDTSLSAPESDVNAV